jgi:DNA-binding CsgD family transcriptional regulator
VHVERRSNHLGVEDLRALFRLEGELGELSRGSDEQRRHALQGLCALVGAQVGIWGNFGDLRRGDGSIRHAIHLGWSGDRERQVYVDYLREGQDRLPDPAIARVAAAVDQPVCSFVRTQLLTNNEWYRAPHVNEYRRTCGVDAFLHSVRAHPTAGYVISLHRPWGARPFTERERRLVDLFHRESRALAPRSEERLSPHLDKTLRALRRGLTEKQVAAELGLSPHTVHDYVRSLYRRFGVTSRAELFARLMGSR